MSAAKSVAATTRAIISSMMVKPLWGRRDITSRLRGGRRTVGDVGVDAISAWRSVRSVGGDDRPARLEQVHVVVTPGVLGRLVDDLHVQERLEARRRVRELAGARVVELEPVLQAGDVELGPV